MKRIITLLSIFTLLIVNAQKVDYDRNSRWYFGLNTGATWHTTDVQTKLKLGYGLVFGKSFNMDYGRILSFDLGFRYLYGYWEGVDKFGTTNFSANNPVNQYYSNNDTYRQNFLSEQHRFALELALHANRLRERTGWDPYIFGGIGLTIHQSYGDVFTYDDNYNAVPYDFDNGQGLDGVYKIPLEADEDGSLYDDFQWRTLPSLGIGLGYYVGPRFSVGLEHKTTFTLTDYYDGTVVNQDGVANNYNDLYHYTNFYLKWYFRTRKVRDDRVEEQRPEEDNLVEDQNKVYLPIVNYTQPSNSPTDVINPNYTIKASIKYVAGKDNVSFTQNGSSINSFIYNPSTDQFSANVSLVPGQNSFTLQGTNEEGVDQETIIINYKREEKTPPSITITKPVNSPQTVYQNTYNLQANALNISAKEDIVFTFNNQVTNNFNYNTQNGVITANLNLNAGTNTVNITVTNEDGSDSDNASLVFRETNTIIKPSVQFTNPANSPYTHNQTNFNLTAAVQNINSADDIVFKINGAENENFEYNTNTGKFSSDVLLSGGQNVFEIIASNNAGSDQDQCFIVFRDTKTPPVVAITNPQNSTYLTNSNVHHLTANILNISNSSQIEFTVNGSTSSNFNYNAQTQSFNATINLIEGNNIVEITASNDDGTDSKMCTIVYKRPAAEQKPEVVFNTPGNTPFYTSTNSQAINASVYNVSNANQISVNLNGNSINNFNFNANTQEVSFVSNLIEGANLIYISATNNAGSDNASQTIIYRKPNTNYPPTVNITAPNLNPTTVYSNYYSLQANVNHVNGSQNITVSVNGVETNAFTYSLSSKVLNLNVGLNQGGNIVEISAVNAYGQATDATSIIYRKPQSSTPPTVNIWDPSSTLTTGANSHTVRATVENINNVSEIDFIVNGTGISNFTYNANTRELSYNLAFNNAGSYTVQVVASNSAGTASDNAVINYRPQETNKLPEIYYLHPNTNNSFVYVPNYSLKAKVLHVDSKNQIILKRNGQTINQNAYTFNTASKELVFNHVLNQGNNNYLISASTNAGSTEESINISYRKIEEECDEPEIKLIQPLSNITSVENTFNLKAEIAHVAASDLVQLKLNGSVLNTLVRNGALNAQLNLIDGNNSIEILAENECGREIKRLIIEYKTPEKPCEEPQIVQSKMATLTTQNTSETFKVQLENISSSNQIKVSNNGNNLAVNYDRVTKQLTVNTGTLQMGQNNIVVALKTDCGSDSKTWTIIRKPCEKPMLNLNPLPAEGEVVTNRLNIKGNIANIESNQAISAVLNGKSILFTYSNFNNSFNLNTNLNLGKNKLVITAKNECGSNSVVYNFNYMPKPVVAKPTLKLVSPRSNPFKTSNQNITVKLKTTGINSSKQIQVKFNGVNTSFKFDAVNKLIKINKNLIKGTNGFQISVANTSGSATVTQTVVYTPTPAIQKPVINITSPTTNPNNLVKPGRIYFTANVQNVSSANQVKLYFNGELFSNYQTTMNNGVLTVKCYVSITENNPSAEIQLIANNAGGTATKTQIIQLTQSKQIKVKPPSGERKPTSPIIIRKRGRR